jgi:predicted TIM-barrel fold metal-dependent hydrolase
MQKIIDVHVHCSDSDEEDALLSYARFNELKYDLCELLALMRENGVEQGLLLSPPMRDGTPLPNERVLELCERSSRALLPVFTVEPGRDSVADCLRLARRNRDALRGFKIRLGYVEVYAYDELFDPLYEYAESEGLPVMFHTGDTATRDGSLLHSHPITLDRLANRRKNLKVVACHFGNPWIMDVAELVYKHENIFADISGLFTGTSKNTSPGEKGVAESLYYYSDRFIDGLARRVSEAIYFVGGVDKVLFGTDYPVETFTSAISFARKLDLRSDSDYNKLFYDNAKKLFSF